MLNSFLSDYFGFNKQQRNGLVVLLLISFILLVARIAYPSFITPDEIVVKNLPLIEVPVEDAFAGQDYSSAKKESISSGPSLFVFDPNTVSLEQLLKLGFKEKTAKRFIKFRSKGFKFKTRKDVQKVYGISEAFYLKLEPYILIGEKKKADEGTAEIAEETKQEQKVRQVKEQTTEAKIELNAADSLALIAVNGIGPAYAKRILKYRKILGGYVSVEQLKEVYGLTEETYNKISPYLTVNPALIKKINLNKDDFKTINKHPYLSYELTKTIFDYRRKTAITSANIKDVIIDEELCRKVLPYLTFE